MMERMQKLELTDTATEAAITISTSSSTDEISSEDRRKSSRRMPESRIVDAASSSHSLKVTIHQLPDLVLTEIFSKLDDGNKAHVARVCKRWCDLVDSPALWQDTTAHLDVDALSSAGLNSLERRHIRSVVVTQCTSQMNLKTVISALPTLEKLSADCFKQTGEGLAEVVPKALPSVKNLSLWLDTLDGEMIKFIAQIFPNISHLRVNVQFSEDPLLLIGNLKNLEELQLTKSGYWVPFLNRPDVYKELEQMSCLRSLTLFGMFLGDQMLDCLSLVCPSLQRLTAYVFAEGMHRLTQFRDLQVLDLRFVNSTVSLSEDLIAKLENIRTLYIRQTCVGDTQLVALAKLPQLEELAISCRNISKEGWRALDQGFRRLKCLTLFQFECNKCAQVESFASLPSLETIVFDKLQATDLEMKSLCSALKYVHSLTIQNTLDIHSEHMKYIAELENLQELQLIGTWVGDEELKQLAGCKSLLETVTLVECRAHDKNLLYFVQSQKSIRKLEFNMVMDHCMLFRIVKELPNLQALKTHMNSMTKMKLQCLRPGLVIQ